MVARVAAVTG